MSTGGYALIRTVTGDRLVAYLSDAELKEMPDLITSISSESLTALLRLRGWGWVDYIGERDLMHLLRHGTLPEDSDEWNRTMTQRFRRVVM